MNVVAAGGTFSISRPHKGPNSFLKMNVGSTAGGTFLISRPHKGPNTFKMNAGSAAGGTFSIFRPHFGAEGVSPRNISGAVETGEGGAWVTSEPRKAHLYLLEIAK